MFVEQNLSKGLRCAGGQLPGPEGESLLLCTLCAALHWHQLCSSTEPHVQKILDTRIFVFGQIVANIAVIVDIIYTESVQSHAPHSYI